MIYITNCRKGSEIWCGWAGWSCLDKQSWQKMRVVDMCIRQREEPIQKLSLSGKHRTFCELHTRFLVGESVKWRGACWRWVQGWGGPSTAPHGEDMRRWHNRLIILKRLSCLFFPLEKKNVVWEEFLAYRIPWTEEPGRLYSQWGCKELDTTEWLTPKF